MIADLFGNKKKVLRKIQKGLANVTQGDYSSDDWETIASHYLNLRKTNHDRFEIDDITWNDLEMNQVFRRLNYTLSSPGEECLYRILREPCFEAEEISRRKELINFFRVHPEKRSALQIPLYLMGKNRDLVLSDCLFSDSETRPDRAIFIYRILATFPLLAGILAFFWKGALFILFMSFLLNMALHYWNKIKKVGDFEVFSRLSQLVTCASSLGELGVKELDHLLCPIRTTSELVKHLRGWMFDKFDYGGDLAAILEYLRIICLQEVIASEISNRALNRQRQELQFLYSSIGFLDALVAISVFQEKTPYFSFPQFQARTATSEPLLEFVDLVHPLLDNPVGYSLKVLRSMLITGSNASGKSTFIKTVAVNAILAQSIAMVLARNYRTGFFKVLTSISIRDNLEKGESYFVVEAKSMKRLVEESTREPLCLFAIDEIFQGTNSVERLAAARELLHLFSTRPVICLAATHDYELVKSLVGRYDNYHFQERIEAGQIVYDYQIEPGYSFSFSALKILRNMGYPSEIIAAAEKNAQAFVQKNLEEYGKIVR